MFRYWIQKGQCVLVEEESVSDIGADTAGREGG